MAESDTTHKEAAGAPRISVKLEEALAAAAMALLCLITMANVVVRYLTNISFAFTEEISVWLMVFMTLVGTAGAFVKGHHIAISFFVDWLSPPLRHKAQLGGLIASTVMFAALAVFGARMAWDDYRFEVTSPALDVPQWLYTVWLPLLSILVVVRLVQMIVAFVKAQG